jgi:hypothetical protein
VIDDPRRAKYSATYRSSATRATVVTVALALVGAVTALSLVHNYSGFALIEDAKAGLLSDAEATSFDATTLVLAILYLAAYLFAGITFLAWLSRCVDNVPSLTGEIPGATPRWSIGWWFVPFANLWKPYEVVKDLDARMSAEGRSTGFLLITWWLVWIFGNIVSFFVSRLPEPTTLEALSEWFTANVGSDIFVVVGAILAILVVRRIQGRAVRRAASGPPAPVHPAGAPTTETSGA